MVAAGCPTHEVEPRTSTARTHTELDFHARVLAELEEKSKKRRRTPTPTSRKAQKGKERHRGIPTCALPSPASAPLCLSIFFLARGRCDPAVTFHPRLVARVVDHRGFRQLRLFGAGSPDSEPPKKKDKENQPGAPVLDRDLASELTDVELAFVLGAEAAHLEKTPSPNCHVESSRQGEQRGRVPVESSRQGEDGRVPFTDITNEPAALSPSQAPPLAERRAARAAAHAASPSPSAALSAWLGDSPLFVISDSDSDSAISVVDFEPGPQSQVPRLFCSSARSALPFDCPCLCRPHRSRRHQHAAAPQGRRPTRATEVPDLPRPEFRIFVKKFPVFGLN